MKMYDDKLVILTGGAGFIGSGVLRELNNRGMTNIIVVDDLNHTEKWKNLVGKNFVDIISKHDIFPWLQGRGPDIEAIIHMGACSSTIETDSGYLLENNYRFTLKLAEYALKYQHRFIYASSAATYGDGSEGFSDDHYVLERLEPLNMYAYSKHLFDLWAYRQGILGNIVGLKFFNIFGPNEHHKGRMASVIPQFVENGVTEGRIRLFKSSHPEKYDDGEQRRDFLYVKDAARIVCDFLESSANGIFNVGSGVASTWNQLVNAIENALDMSITVEYIDMPEDLIGKYQNYTCADISKLKACEDVGSTMTSLDDAVKNYIRNYLRVGKLW